MPLTETLPAARTSSRVFKELDRIFGVAFAVGGDLPALKQMLNAVQEGIAIVVRCGVLCPPRDLGHAPFVIALGARRLGWRG